LHLLVECKDQKINRSSDLVARYGGEAFAIVLVDSSVENCEFVINIVLQTIHNLNIIHRHSKVANHLTMSVGAALITEFSAVPLNCDYEQLIKAADDALYEAKKGGRNRGVRVNYSASRGEAEFCQQFS
jgi:diguanylate cyclase (GGDEF)-like protein